MSNDSDFGKQMFDGLSKVRVTSGKVELPIRANSEDGIQIGSFRLPKAEPRSKADRHAGRGGLLARLLRRLRRTRSD